MIRPLTVVALLITTAAAGAAQAPTRLIVNADLGRDTISRSRVSGRVLTAPAINSRNTFEQPTMVQPSAFHGARLSGDRLSVHLPPKSVVVLELR